ncbi:hypothetical protein H5410_051717, partial [Solanum commersonii]
LSLENEDVDSVPPALESFTKIEKIEFSCEKCKIQGSFEKQLLVERASSVAAVHLKRFKNEGFIVQKVDKHVSFALELDMLLYTNEINNDTITTSFIVLQRNDTNLMTNRLFGFKKILFWQRRHTLCFMQREAICGFQNIFKSTNPGKSSNPFNFFVHSK